MHRPGPGASGMGQDGFIAMEYWQQDFDAIKYATSKGIIVVEAAGNGSRNLDDVIYNNRFNRSIRGDCGAIVVGAGAPSTGNHGPDRSRLGFSNYGKIVDAQGWGRDVVTTGYGNLQGGTDENKWYTRTFSGTSSASPIVVGAVACLQGIRKAKGDSLLTYSQLRNLFTTTGSPQQDAPSRPTTQNIGKRPNLRAAYERLYPKNTCNRYLEIARRYYKLYRSTKNRRYLCVYYNARSKYYRCIYQEKKIKQHRCLYYYNRALYYLCHYRRTRRSRYLTIYRKYMDIYRKCR